METKVAEFRVRNVGLAGRCEVCHQDDLFDPATGECRRCRGGITAFKKSGAPLTIEFHAQAPVLLVGRRMARSASIISSILAIPGVFGLLMLVVNVVYFLIRESTLSTTSLFWMLMLAVTLLTSTLGFILNYWYWRIVHTETETGARKAIWVISTIYNAILLLVGIVSSIPLVFPNDLLIITWLVAIFLMTTLSASACFVEFRPEILNGQGK